ncbi:MAG TPA: ABC transporter ATP-binding protein [Nitrospiria bacterium]|nr:ABC transporter ATP-binding protein [Nitrospiria bacterium]
MIRIEGVTFQLESAGRPVQILEDINLSIPKKQFVAVTGPSGSGKSTLLGLLAGLDRPTAGKIFWDDIEITHLGEDSLARLRRERIGMVFQSFFLIPTLTALENVMVPLELLGRLDSRAAAASVLSEVGLSERIHHYPAQLSGGEQQRVAAARAFAANPPLLLADEPTGNLDSASGKKVMDLLFRLHRDRGSTLILVTHDPTLTLLAERVISLRDGRIVRDSREKET